MRLKKIKLAGFKSFVDPTTVPVAANLVGIVGPNGCGKSNIIDAVRWVLGESSARNLRGESLADVIFSGSSARKPVSQASVELIFDNTSGRVAGEYARYAEIVVRREVTRDGVSDYFLNKARCRRKDITDLFLGTGLGPRAYSIIEQGMIARIVEARPEDLRSFLEEAAGISRYKERRRETETRLRHVRENLARVEDVRRELDLQLARLKRQAAAAENYKAWRQRERELRVTLAANQFRYLSMEMERANESVARAQTAVEAEVARQRAIEADLEVQRFSRNEQASTVGVAHERLYALTAEVARAEQEIAHVRALLGERRAEQQSVTSRCERLATELAEDERREQSLTEELQAIVPRRDAAQQAEQMANQRLREAETALDSWRRSYEDAGLAAAGPARIYAGARADVGRHRARDEDLKRRISRLENEIRSLCATVGDGLQTLQETAVLADRDYDAAKECLTGLEARLVTQRSRLEAASAEYAEQQAAVKAAEARLASLGSMQAQALRTGHEVLTRWLREEGLSDAPRLATKIKVESGWERATERWLGPRLAAVCVPAGTVTVSRVAALVKTPIILFEMRTGQIPTEGLAAKVTASFALENVFQGAKSIESLEAALAQRAALALEETWVTPEGICIGRDFIAFAGENDERAGVLAREREIVEWTGRRDKARAALAVAEQAVAGDRAEVDLLESQRSEAQRAINRCADARTRAHGAAERAQAEDQARTARHERLHTELADLQKEVAQCLQELAAAEITETQAKNEAEKSEQGIAALATQRATFQSAVDVARNEVHSAHDACHRLEIEQREAQTAREAMRERIKRARTDVAHLLERRQVLTDQIEAAMQSENAPRERLTHLLEERQSADQSLKAAQDQLEEKEQVLRSMEQARVAIERVVREKQESVSQETLRAHALKVRRDALVEGLSAQGVDEDIAEMASNLDASLDATRYEQELSALIDKISRLGAVNLVAIDEYAEQSQRQTFLEAQQQDLMQALALLDEAIRKIDGETRTRFKETFDRVNADFKAFFPRLFGGGEAQLTLSSDDLLETGVSIVARPPGKRNSTIQLLSGGEKALVAVSLVFALFALNPAPFCILDEVDAPLDEANVGRFAQTLQELAKNTQMLFVTHNKITMEVAEVLLGVTTAEPGVSRLVSVDVEEALEMVNRQPAGV